MDTGLPLHQHNLPHTQQQLNSQIPQKRETAKAPPTLTLSKDMLLLEQEKVLVWGYMLLLPCMHNLPCSLSEDCDQTQVDSIFQMPYPLLPHPKAVLPASKGFPIPTKESLQS